MAQIHFDRVVRRGKSLVRIGKSYFEVTPWFHGPDENPSRPGPYQIDLDATYLTQTRAGIGWCWFDGERWGWGYESKRDALLKDSRNTEGTTQRKVWRGCVRKYRLT